MHKHIVHETHDRLLGLADQVERVDEPGNGLFRSLFQLVDDKCSLVIPPLELNKLLQNSNAVFKWVVVSSNPNHYDQNSIIYQLFI